MVLDSNDTNLVYEEGSGLMKCENCNNIIDPSYNACPYCGNLVKKTENVQANDENLNVQPNMNVQPNAGNVNLNTQPSINNNGKKKSKGLIVAIAIILVVIGGLVGGLIYFSSSKQVFKLAIDKVTNPILESIGGGYDSYITEFEFKGKLNVDEELDENAQVVVNLINGLSLKGKFGYDYNNKKAVMGIEGNYDNDEIAAIKMYLKDSKAYIDLDDMFDKYISIDVEDYDQLFQKSDLNKDLEVVIEEGRNALKSSLKSEYFEKEKVDGYTKHTLGISAKVLSEITVSMFEDLKENDKFLTSVCNIADVEKQDVIDMLGETIEEFTSTSDYDTEVIFEISIYTKGLFGSVAKVEVKETIDELIIVVEKESKDNYKYSIELDNEEVLTGKVYCKEDKNSLDLKVSALVEGVEMEIDFSYKIDTKGKIDEINTNNSIDYNELTDTDINNIAEKLAKNKGFEKLVEEFENLDFDSTFPDDSDDYYDGNLEQPVLGGTYKLSYFGEKPEVYVTIPDTAELNYQLSTSLDIDYTDSVTANISIGYGESPNDYFATIEKYDVKNLKDIGYKNVEFKDMKELVVNNRKFYYRDLNYIYEGYAYDANYYRRYICIQLSDNILYQVEIESKDQEVPTDLINTLLNFETR